ANRRWVVRVAPLVREQGVGLSERLADIYQSKWPKEKIRVEVCAFANSAGAYTTLDPLRVTIASTDPRNQGPEALEVLFHEASHDIARPVETAITRECRQRDKPIPRDLWHALIFFTTGEVLRPIMQEAEQQNAPDDDLPPQRHTTTTVPPGLSEKLSQRGWEVYSRLLSVYWQPYLDVKVSFEDAIAHLVCRLLLEKFRSSTLSLFHSSHLPARPQDCHPERSGPIFSSAPPSGTSGRAVEGSRHPPTSTSTSFTLSLFSFASFTSFPSCTSRLLPSPSCLSAGHVLC